MIYNPEQISAIEGCKDFIKNGDANLYFLIEGKAGTGKTTVIKEVIKECGNKKIVVGALSHKAKYVIKETIERENIKGINYSSIAGMLNLRMDLETGIFKKQYTNGNNPNNINNFDLIIIDEASMVNEEMIEMIFKEKRGRAKVIFLGDIGQLPPIRTKLNPYYMEWDDYELGINSPVFNTINRVRLTERVRQGEESPILPFADFFWENSLTQNPVTNPANIINRKTIINDKGCLIFVNETREMFKTILDLFNTSIKTNKPNLIKFVTYRNKTRELINTYIHQYFFGKDCNTFQNGELIIFNDNFGDFENSSEFQIMKRHEDFIDKTDNLKIYLIEIIFNNTKYNLPILHPDSYKDHERLIKNKFSKAFELKKIIDNYDVLKKDNIDLESKKSIIEEYKKLLEQAWSEKTRFPNIDYAYSISTHKSQGSTYDIVVVHEQDINSVKMIDNKQKSQSIYTAITRSKNISVIISSERIYNNIDTSDLNLHDLNNNINKHK